MALTTWSFPTTIVFGPGALSALPAQATRLNAKRPLLVCDPGIVKAGLAARVQKTLESAGFAVSVFDKVDPNPVEANVSNGVAAYKAHQADLIVSLGGGSPLDVGKLIALKTTHDRPLHEYDDAIGGDAHITSNVPPIITIPTKSADVPLWLYDTNGVPKLLRSGTRSFAARPPFRELLAERAPFSRSPARPLTTSWPPSSTRRATLARVR
jgi:alcohol dehydrogenase YqhD (iron-dependent ADH family)